MVKKMKSKTNRRQTTKYKVEVGEDRKTRRDEESETGEVMGRSPNKKGETFEEWKTRWIKEEKQKLVGRVKIRKKKQRSEME